VSRPKLRKVNTTKRKEKRKEAQERLASQASLMMNHPTECCVCKKLFTRDHTTVKTWMITVLEEKKAVHLTCPDCWGTIEEVIECQE